MRTVLVASRARFAPASGPSITDHFSTTRAVALLKAANRQVFDVPTLRHLHGHRSGGQSIPEAEKERARRIRATGYEGFRRALAARLPIGFGTDSQVIPHGRNAMKFSERVRRGESPMAAIVAATSIDPEIIGWQDRIGSLAPGRLADLIAVPGDPLKDLTVLAQVGVVMKGGEMYREELIQHSRR